MPFTKHYQDELHYLRESGQAFAKANPKLAPFLGTQSKDPEVLRLQEGLAFLAAKLNERMDGYLPEISHQLLHELAPDMMQAQPSMSVLQYSPATSFDKPEQCIPKGTAVKARKGGREFAWRTVSDVNVQALKLKRVKLETQAKEARLNLQFTMPDKKALSRLALSSLPLYLSGDLQTAATLYYWLRHKVQSVELSVGKATHTLSTDFKAAGLGANMRLPSSWGQATGSGTLLREYFASVEKFLFVELSGLDVLADSEASTFEVAITVALEQHIPVPRINIQNILLYCTPIVNVSQVNVRPFLFDGQEDCYAVTLDGAYGANQACLSLTKVSGWVDTMQQHLDYKPLHRAAQDDPSIYQFEQTWCPATHRLRTHLRFGYEAVTEHNKQSISIEALGFDIDADKHLSVGDIAGKDATTQWCNVSKVSSVAYPPYAKKSIWQLINVLAMSFSQVDTPALLQKWLRAYYDFSSSDVASAAHFDKVESSIQKVSTHTDSKLLHGAPLRGSTSTISFADSEFASVGEWVILGDILNAIFQDRAPVNQFHRVNLYGIDNKARLAWPHCST